MTTIQIGSIARHKIHGFEGVVSGVTRWLTNVDQYTLSPQRVNEDGTPSKSRTFDAGSLIYVGESGVNVTPVDRIADAPELGDTVKARISGCVGVVTAQTTWIEGCVSLNIQPKTLDKDGQPADVQAYDERGVDVVERANPKPALVKTGGPRSEPKRATAR